MWQFLTDLFAVPGDLLITLGIVMALAFLGVFGLLTLVVMAAEIATEE